MNQRASFTSVVLAILCLSSSLPRAVLGQDAATGAVKGNVTASGVRSPEDVVVYLQNVPGEHQPPAQPVAMDQKKLVFVPHVLVVVRGTTVEFKNGDPLLHNVFWPASDDGSYPANNLGTWGQGDSKKFMFDKEGHVVLLCNIHAEMEGHVLVVQNPFSSVVTKDGLYEIKNVPPGEYTLTTFYPQPKKLKAKSMQVTVAAGKTVTQDISLGRR
jgi:plastocyanin